MIAPGRLALSLAVSLLLSGGTAAIAAATKRSKLPHPVDARVSATFVMRGQILTAVGVPGERRRQHVTRRWTFTGTACTGNVCRQLLLTRERSAGQFDQLVLFRTGTGRYAGNGRFYVPVQCLGAIYPQGQVAPYRVTVDVMRSVKVQGIAFATALTASYTNPSRTDRTACPTGPSHDAASYSGTASPPPSPPAGGFSFTVTPGTETATFTSTATPGGDQSPITTVLWQFGDPATAAANAATTPQAAHTFSAPGTYVVSLTVTDATGLSATQSQQVVAPAPPT